MMMIVAHHFVLCSGLTVPGGPLNEGVFSANSLFLRLFGMWGKVGINCFVMITGYFMCESKITLKKWLKLLLEIYFYKVSIYIVFAVAGFYTISLRSIVNLILPINSLQKNFSDCFIVFYLTIPFWNILVHNMTKKQHQLLLLLLLFCYTLMGSIPSFDIDFNYISWFGVIYLMASYIRLHPTKLFNDRHRWGWITLALVIISMCSVAYIHWKTFAGYFFVSDSNKILAVLVAVSSFLWFRNLEIRQSKFINTVAASTFGVLLIHSGSGSMMKWLWEDLFNVSAHFTLPTIQLILYSVSVVLVVYSACTIIDHLRIRLLEKPFFDWYDKRLEYKINKKIKAE